MSANPPTTVKPPEGQSPATSPATPSPEVLSPEVLSPMMTAALGSLGAMVLEHRRDFGDDRIHVARENIVDVCRALRDEPALAFDMLLDVTAVDYFGNPD